MKYRVRSDGRTSLSSVPVLLLNILNEDRNEEITESKLVPYSIEEAETPIHLDFGGYFSVEEASSDQTTVLTRLFTHVRERLLSLKSEEDEIHLLGGGDTSSHTYDHIERFVWSDRHYFV